MNLTSSSKASEPVGTLPEPINLTAARDQRRQQRIDDLAAFIGFPPEVVLDALTIVATRDRTLVRPQARGAA
jgi:hypothetical protein